jgi:hypothetical protein
MHRYWFEFRESTGELPPGVGYGLGVTARDQEDALTLMAHMVFDGPVPAPRHIVEDIDISTLDDHHVRPNMGDPSVRGVWFPLGYA